MLNLAMMPCKGPKLVKDRGYAWLILTMSFLSHFLHIGFSLGTIGNLTTAQKQFFNIDIQQSSLIGSVHSGLFFMFGPFSSVVLKKIGCRFTEMMGGVCIILGVGLSSLSTVPWHAFLLYSVLAAFGISLTYAASTEILALHFERHRYLAFSIAPTGTFVAMIVWPIVSQHLLSTLGYSKAMGILSICHITHVVAGILFFEPSLGVESSRNPPDSLAPPRENIDALKNCQLEETEKKHYDNKALDASQVEISQLPANTINDETLETSKRFSGNNDAVRDDFVTLLKLPKVWALLINAMLWNANVSSFLILINDYILRSTSMTKEEISVGLTILGVMNIVACVLVICTSSLRFERLLLHFSCTMLYSICTIVIAFTNGKTMFYIMIGIWGFGQGASIANLVGVISSFCNVKQLAVLFGLNLLTEGIGGMAAAPLCALIADRAGDRYGIIFSGCLGVVGSCCILPVILSRVCYKCKEGVNDQSGSPAKRED